MTVVSLVVVSASSDSPSSVYDSVDAGKAASNATRVPFPYEGESPVTRELTATFATINLLFPAPTEDGNLSLSSSDSDSLTATIVAFESSEFTLLDAISFRAGKPSLSFPPDAKVSAS